MWKGLLELKLKLQLISWKYSFRLDMTSQQLVAILLLSASVLVSVVESACPDAEAIEPCTCREFGSSWARLTCRNITDVSELEKAAQNSYGYKYKEVGIESSTLQYIPKVVLETIRMERLLLENLTLTRFVDSIPNTLEELWLVQLYKLRILNGLSWNIFKNTPGLKHLNVFRLTISSIKADFNQYVSHNLKYLQFTTNGLKKIEKGAFQGFQSIEMLAIANNNLKSLRRDYFPVPFNVGILNLQRNKLTTIPDDFFSEMPVLRNVYLNNNLIASINEKVFPISVSAHVSLSDNPIKCDCFIKWIVDRKPNYIYGVCAYPKRLIGKSFSELSQSDFDC